MKRRPNVRALARTVEGRELPRYIAVEGPIGVGKTTLATKLADAFDYPLLREPVAENPFLDRFYREGRRNALPTQLFFLLHRVQQIASIHADDLLGPMMVADYLIDKDRLFARLTLDDHELNLYDQIRESLAVQAPTPDLVIYLQAPVNALMDRIRRRGHPAEQHIDFDYLNELNDAYTEFFHFFDAAPLLIVNAAGLDFANDDAHFEALLERVLAVEGARHYFNPQPTLIS